MKEEAERCCQETESVSIDTFLAQIGNKQDPTTGAVNTPIHLSTTFQHPTLGESTGFDYSRTQNPTRKILEEALAVLESGSKAFATSSGMSAIQLIFSLFKSGSHFVSSRDLYGGSFRYFQNLEAKGQFNFSYSDTEEGFEELITPETVALFVETPTNPLMNEVSIERLARLSKKHELLLIVDNTFYTPLIQKPLDLGADIVIHSATKYLGGHNDVLAGAVIVKNPEIGERLAYEHNTTGAVLSPFDSWLLIRGLKTLALRMEKIEQNATEIITYLENEPTIKEVFYPGRGGMISFKVTDSQIIKSFLAKLKLVTFAESLGGVESLITYPTTQTHADIPIELRESYGLTPDLLRLSVGIESAKDIIKDLEQAFQNR